MGDKLFNEHFLCPLLTDWNGFRIWDDYFLEVIDVVTIYVVAMLDLADWDLSYCIITEY